MWMIAVDGGQTSTKVALYDSDTGSLFEETGPPIDHMLTISGQNTARAGIQLPLRAALEKAGGPAEIAAAVLSVSGVRKGDEALIADWVSQCADVRSCTVVEDAAANLTGASAGRNDGILVIAGGGSIAYFAHGADVYTTGGYGHILGDEGSAYWIGLHALQAAVRGSEGRGERTALTERILAHFRSSSFWDIKTRVHGETWTRRDMADLAILVSECAEASDAVSQRLLTQAGEMLGGLVTALVRKLPEKLRAEALNVYPTGGVFRSGQWVVPAFKGTIQAEYPSCRIKSPAHSPLIGALILAADKAGLKLTWNGNIDTEV